MRKLMKMLSLLSVIFYAGTTVGCLTTIEYVTIKPDYSEPPAREQVEEPETVEDLAIIIVYYEKLLSEWESWGISVYDTLDIPLPNSLQWIKDLEE